MYELSPKVEQITPPLIFVEGRAYRLAPSVMTTLAALTDPGGPPNDTDPRVVARLVELGILTNSDGTTESVPPKRVRHPLSIHVRAYSTALLRIFERIGTFYPLRNTLQAGIVIIAGIAVFGWMLRDIQMAGGVGGLIARVSPIEVIAAVVCTVLAMVLHEAAHVAAARGSGCRVPRAGVGIYVTSIVCFVDLSTLTDTTPARRRHVDIAGMTADSLLLIAIWVLGLVHIVSVDFAALVAISHISGLLFTLNPWIKSDGYWLLRDSFPRPTFDPSNWLLQPRCYAARILRPSSPSGDTRLLRTHFVAGVAWLVVTILWTITVFVSFLAQPSYTSDVLGHWLMTAATALVTLVGISAVALALLKGSQWRSS
ncbi:hypothetical protein [Rhodococcus sp. Q]|uniref:hypothetical protein n=1 Tax=Rhodococcus sp. Q TaxID=2502252 RepID=UPI0010F9E31F|nr:hypothetical protein [Rhodococcus sp. Q]